MNPPPSARRPKAEHGSGGGRAAKPRGWGHPLSSRDHGKTTFAGYVDEPATVTVNGNPAVVMSTDGGAPYKFEAVVDLDAGSNTVVVQAKDGQNNTGTKTYSVTTTGTAKTYEYDATGNLRYEKLPDTSVVREYRWDQQNRLVRAIIGTHESVYEYDGESKRVRIRELESSVETKNETFVWCGSRICQKRSGSTVERNYFEQGFEEGTSEYVYTRDHLRSVREVVGSDGATVAGRVSYDPWGKMTETGSGALSDVSFTGHLFDRPTELGLTWWRGYDAGLGRWISRDPIGLKGGLNLYGYVANEPSNKSDHSGRGPDTFCSMFGWLLPDFICDPVPGPHPDPPPGPGGGGSGGGSGGAGGGGGGICDPPPPPKDPRNLKRCQEAAKGDFSAWDRFCGSLTDLRYGQIRAVCRSYAFSKMQEQLNACYNWFGE